MSLSPKLLAVVVAVGLLAGACGGNDDADDRSGTGGPSTTTAEATGAATPAVGVAEPTAGSTPEPGLTSSPVNPEPEPVDDDQQAPANQPVEPSLVLTPVVSLPDPIALVARPDTGSGPGDLYVATRDGRVWLLGADGDEPPVMVLDIGDLTTTDCEEGLLGIAFSPDGSHLYLHYTDLRGDNQIVEYPMSGQWVEGDQGRTVLSVDEPACNHNGGHIVVGPDGYLWIGFGDGGGRDDMFNQGQDLDTLLATMVRIDSKSDGGSAYSIPADNPFADGVGRAEIWHYGARNPWRFSFDRATGDLWIADVGQNTWEEIHVLRAADDWKPGANLGWPLFEGDERFSGTATPDDLDFPAYVYHHDDGCSITGGHVYRGTAIPHLVGTYVFGDFCQGRIWGLTIDDQGAATRVELGLSVPQGTLVSFGEDAAGELYVLSFDDTVYRLVPSR
ncbi:MAG: PQQ-dependent sugar dehydrogenase [Acidimicrobiia bacterium]|nr:PQQ-dependent sugar dehydrogenase [Acidimicrobiia bacterium]MYG57120.1 PQQ-dependent sugar dehydrogenase [Acidimicrobiia bacterium]MYJ31464.1 PQQ-dependent sugar dehydrogenase [Acidimicrobiia bacterium]